MKLGLCCERRGKVASGTNRGLRGHLLGLTGIGLHTGIPALECGQ